ncbi:MAG: class I SAM-dependent methyltransferase [Candidatus Woesearchaeota archaeon]
MDSSYVKEYFSSPGTVSAWWEPMSGDKSHIFKRQHELIIETLAKERRTTVLDIACGKGRISKLLLEQGYNVYSLDISQEMLNIAKNRGYVQKPFLGDSEDLPFINDSFDVVICMDAMVHFPNPSIAALEAYRVLRPDGIFLVNTSNPYDLGFIPRNISSLIRRIANTKIKSKGEGIFRYISPGQMEKYLTDAGFNIEKKNRQGLIAPIEVKTPKGRDVYILSEKTSKRLDGLDRILERTPIINRLCISTVYEARK